MSPPPFSDPKFHVVSSLIIGTRSTSPSRPSATTAYLSSLASLDLILPTAAEWQMEKGDGYDPQPPSGGQQFGGHGGGAGYPPPPHGMMQPPPPKS